MSELQAKSPEITPEEPLRPKEAGKSPESLIKTLKDGVHMLERLEEKLTEATKGTTAATAAASKKGKKALPKAEKPIIVNWHYLATSYKTVSKLALKSIYHAVEKLRTIREIIFQSTEKTIPSKLQKAAIATYLFFTL